MSPQTSNDPPPDGPRQIKSVLTAVDILETIRKRRGATLTEIEAESDLTKGTIYTYLVTLCNVGLVRKDDGGSYQLGFRSIIDGEHARNQMDLYRAGRTEVKELATRTGEFAHLVAEWRASEVAIYEATGDRAVAEEYHLRLRETPQELYTSAAGKAILAFLPESRRTSVLAEMELDPKTDRTITDPAALRENLETVRERGYAVSDGEKIRGTRSVGAPVFDCGKRVTGAVSLTAPTSRMKGKRFTEEVPEAVMETANLIEVNLETT